MFIDYEPCPFWFASTKLLTKALQGEIDALIELLDKNRHLHKFLDNPNVTLPQRATCFVLLAHRKLIDTMYDTLTARYEQPSLSRVKLKKLKRTYNLVVPDAPTWALEMNQVVERLPTYIYNALPKPLRQGGFNPEKPQQMQAIESAKETLSSVEQVQALTERVINQQLERLRRRWLAAIVKARAPNKRKGWEQRENLYEAIRAALDRDPSPQGKTFCAELDKRHAPPLHDWVKKEQWREGLTWKEAWANSQLRKKIRRVRQEAMKRR